MSASMDVWYLAFALFALSMSASPGPNNVMVTASGANFGFRRTVPHMFGIALGFPVLLFAIGFGLGAVFRLHPFVQTAMQAVSAVYLLYLAWRIATARPGGEDEPRGEPLTFVEAAAFQWLNPKAWMIAISALGVYAPAELSMAVSLSVMSGIFIAACLPSVALWTAIGVGTGRLLSSDKALRGFNLVMAGLLVVSLFFVFFPIS